MSAPHRHSALLWLLLAALVVFTAWAAFFELDQTVRAQGQIIPSARTQILQAADGGVVTDIRVKEGQTVQAGEILAVLEKDRSQAGVEDAQAKLAAQQAALIRLNAEARQQQPSFPATLASEFPQFVAAQQGLYQQRKAALDAELQSLDRAIALARDEFDMHQRLFKSGDVARVEVMRSERQLIELEGRQRTVLDKYRSEARHEIAKIEEESAASRYRLDERESVLKHTEIRAPMAGVVKYVRITTVGGVLRQGDELMQISPADEESLVEIKLNPADIGQLTTGLPAGIRLDAFDSSIFGTLNGQLTYVSPDTLSEQGASGQQQIYYRAHVRVDWKAKPTNTRIEPTALKPGMTATIDIRTGSRTVLAYLFKPIHKAFSGALSEK
ncbi:HlyD family efflux transporter periplasmic adaptor subunit [Aquabacterium sp.]|uniref:HlyD family efflux transporter periplasmic adaptor subunit n=1 Tax=Aquabacterium sp. TaxID=1872578 RepID=UPI003CFF57FE